MNTLEKFAEKFQHLLHTSNLKSLVFLKLYEDLLNFIRRYIPNVWSWVKNNITRYFEKYVLNRVFRTCRVEVEADASPELADFFMEHGVDTSEKIIHSYYNQCSGIPPTRVKSIVYTGNSLNCVFKGYHFSFSNEVFYTKAPQDIFDEFIDKFYARMYSKPHISLYSYEAGEELVSHGEVRKILKLKRVTFDNSSKILIAQKDIQDLLFNTVEDRLINNDPRFTKKCVLAFIGPPGTGKTTSIKMIALKFGCDIIQFHNLSEFYHFIHIQEKVSSRLQILVFEDFDKFIIQGADAPYLLNFMDGVGSIENYIIIFSFNNLKKVEQRIFGFSRPGRLDQQITFHYPTRRESIEYVVELFETTEEIATNYIDGVISGGYHLCYASIRSHFQAVRGDVSELHKNQHFFYNKYAPKDITDVPVFPL